MIGWALAIPAGLALAGWSLRKASDEAGAAWLRWVSVLLAPAGILLALAGAVGVAVPGFYGG